MNDDRARDALRLAEAALADALREGVTEAEALVMAEDSALTRFANSEIHQNVAETNVTINLRVVVGKRVGVASSGRTDAEGLRRLAEQRRRDRPGRRGARGLGRPPGPDRDPRRRRRVQPGDRGGASPEFRAEAVRAVIAAADDARRHRLRLVRDRDRIDRGRQLGRRARVRDAHDRRSSSRSRWGRAAAAATPRPAAVDASTIDAAALGREAAGKARATANAVSVEPGDYPVVLEEYAVVDLLDMLGYLGFSALAVQEERSFFEAGKRIGSDLVTIVDDGDDPAGLPLWFDYEGVAKQRVELVERGHLPRGRLRRPDRGPRRRGVDRSRPAGPEPVGPVPAEHVHGRPATRRATT